ncbi:MAG TPA: mechanosensitive ion channel family protein [Flavobacterium sp.]|jgi:small-conductance mechanosensitive channel|nr:mechanosensitive ion channel family protein [Flavobacterium sp.]
MPFVNLYFQEIISTGILFLVVLLLRYIASKLIRKYARVSDVLEHRVNLVIKYFSIFFTVIGIIGVFIIWGVDTDNLITTFSAVITVIGVAFFAQWSILSNITSGIILIFSFPFRIGDFIRIHDKDFPIEAEIMDILAFHTLLQTAAGERISYPNNLLLQKGVTILDELPTTQPEFTD